jgi:hypothetical protein
MEIEIGDFLQWHCRDLGDFTGVCLVVDTTVKYGDYHITVKSYYDDEGSEPYIESDNLMRSNFTKKLSRKLAFLILGEERFVALLKEGTN